MFPYFSSAPRSALGPSLFKIYVNDLPAQLSSDCLLFADDLKLWASVTTSEEYGELQDDLERLSRWSERWLLPINQEKCAVLHLGPGSPFGPYYLDGNPVKVVDVEKDLGILVSGSLKSKPDSLRKAAAASRMMWAIRRSFATLKPQTFQLLFGSHVRPILEYGLPASYPLTKGEKSELEKVQRRATKMVSGLQQLSYEDRLDNLNLYPLELRRQRYDLLTTRRILLGDYGDDLKSFFPLSDDPRTRGHPLKLRKKRTLRLAAQFTLSTRVVNLWNSLPSEAVLAESEDRFKALLDTDHLWIIRRGSADV